VNKIPNPNYSEKSQIKNSKSQCFRLLGIWNLYFFNVLLFLEFGISKIGI